MDSAFTSFSFPLLSFVHSHFTNFALSLLLLRIMVSQSLSCGRFSLCTRPQLKSHSCAMSNGGGQCQQFAMYFQKPTPILSFARQSGMFTRCLQKQREAEAEAEAAGGEEGVWSVIIPTYNRLPILTKCLQALEEQCGYSECGISHYEVIVVDDGSTDATFRFLTAERVFDRVKVVRQEHAGAAKARNLGFNHSRGSVIVFIDSDLVVTPHFLRDHARALYHCFNTYDDQSTFTYGRVINTNDFQNPHSQTFQITDNSGAFFATGNVAISRKCLIRAASMLSDQSDGPFDTVFSEYGWEDLELGFRLRKDGARIKRLSNAVGYHWHPSFSYDQLPILIEKEKQRGRTAAYFFKKHPVFRVRWMIQMTPIHEAIWFLLTLGGILNEKTLAPLIKTLVDWGKPQLAEGLISPFLNWYTIQATKEAMKKLK